VPLSQKEELFCREFLLDLNASAAARRASYAERYVNRIACRLMSKVDIQERIAELKRERAERVQVEADGVLRELLLLVAFSDIGDPNGGILDFSGDQPTFRPARQVSRGCRKAVASWAVTERVIGHGGDAVTETKTKFTLWNKVQALDKLMRHLGLLKEKEPLEAFLARLPSELAASLRGLLLTDLQQGRGERGAEAE
jgi:phage terminase small subunit